MISKDSLLALVREVDPDATLDDEAGDVLLVKAVHLSSYDRCPFLLVILAFSLSIACW